MKALEWLQDHLFLWRSRCPGCGHRRCTDFYGKCIDCAVVDIHRRTGDAIVAAFREYVRIYGVPKGYVAK